MEDEKFYMKVGLTAEENEDLVEGREVAVQYGKFHLLIQRNMKAERDSEPEVVDVGKEKRRKKKKRNYIRQGTELFNAILTDVMAMGKTGLSCSEIGKKHGVPASTVSSIKHRYKVGDFEKVVPTTKEPKELKPKAKKRGYIRQGTPEFNAIIDELKNKKNTGFSLRDIANKLNVPYTTVNALNYRWIHGDFDKKPQKAKTKKHLCYGLHIWRGQNQATLRQKKKKVNKSEMALAILEGMTTGGSIAWYDDYKLKLLEAFDGNKAYASSYRTKAWRTLIDTGDYIEFKDGRRGLKAKNPTTGIKCPDLDSL